MATFRYEATDARGKVITGTVDARNQEAAVEVLRGKKQFPISISAQHESASLLKREFSLQDFFQRIRQRDVMTYTQQLATLVDAGLPLDHALGILTELQERPKFKRILLQIRRDVQAGSTLTDSMAKHPKLFNRLYINMVRAGETGGVLELIFLRLSGFLERAQEMRTHILSALLYPAILLSIGGLAVIVLVTMVIPKFQAIFEDLGEALPVSTQFLMSLSNLVRGYWFLILGLGILLVVGFRNWVGTPEGRRKWDTLKLRAPFFGDLLRKIEIARFSRTLGTLVKSGVPILQALSIVKETLTNDVISNALISVYGGIKEGEGISRPLRESGVFPPLAIHMIRVGEETGRLEAMLEKVAEAYENEVQSTIKRLLALLEPAMILFMGVLVGFIVYSIMQAIFQFSTMAGR